MFIFAFTRSLVTRYVLVISAANDKLFNILSFNVTVIKKTFRIFITKDLLFFSLYLLPMSMILCFCVFTFNIICCLCKHKLPLIYCK